MPTPKVKTEKKIFISHASIDKPIVQEFIDLILHGSLSVGIDDIFSSTIEGTKIESGDDWRDSIKENLISAKITFIIITPNYKESEVSLNEMGAAWVLSGKTLPVIVEPINYKTVGVIQEPKQIEKLLDENSLDRIRDIVQRELEIPIEKIKSDRWSEKKKDFIKKVKKHIEDNPFPVAMDRKAYDTLLRENGDLNNTVGILIEDKEQLGKQIIELEKIKEGAAVKAIKKKYHPSTAYDDFIELCKKVTSLLKPFRPIIRGIVFKTYNSKTTQFDWQVYKKEIESAEAEDYIEIDEDDGTIEADWSTTADMRDLYSNLRKLESFIDKTSSLEFYDEYESHFKAPLKIDNKSFWDEAFKLPITLN